VGDAGDVLLDDRTLVQVGGDVVGGRADELDAAAVRLCVGARALEAGEEGVVDVDDAARHAFADLLGDDLHVAGEDQEFDVLRPHQVQEFLLGACLRLLGDGDQQEGHPVELGDGRQVGMVADNGDDLDGQALAALAVEQVGQAVTLTRDHDDGPQGSTQLVHVPGRAEVLGDLFDALLDGGATDG